MKNSDLQVKLLSDVLHGIKVRLVDCESGSLFIENLCVAEQLISENSHHCGRGFGGGGYMGSSRTENGMTRSFWFDYERRSSNTTTPLGSGQKISD